MAYCETNVQPTSYVHYGKHLMACRNRMSSTGHSTTVLAAETGCRAFVTLWATQKCKCRCQSIATDYSIWSRLFSIAAHRAADARR